jgi:hypothetical protein
MQQRGSVQPQPKGLMKKQITYLITALLATIAISNAAPPDKAAMEGKEKAAWQAFKDKNEADFKKVVDKDFRGVYAEGISNMQKELDDMKKWDMKSFEISDYDMFSDEKDVVVTTYKVKLEGTYEGKDLSGTYNAGSVWKQENGKWMAIFHTNVKPAAGQ